MLNHTPARLIDIFGPEKSEPGTVTLRSLMSRCRRAPLSMDAMLTFRSCHGESMPIWGDPVLGMDKQFTGPRQTITFDGAVPHSEN